MKRQDEAARIVLTTHSFQAPEFYENCGFCRIAAVDDYPKGHWHILMVKLKRIAG